MVWLKRNMMLVVGGLVAVILLGASGFFLYSGYQKNGAVSLDLQQAADEFTRLSQRAPSATAANIDAAKIEQDRFAKLVEDYREFFAPVGSYTNIDSADFKFLLANTLVDLNNLADDQGVKRPRGFAYTFGVQQTNVVFNTKELLPWTYQLLEIRQICEVIYGARVHSLLRILRASTSTNEAPAVVLRGAKISTNLAAKAVCTPYEVVFQGFSTELAEVLDRFERSPQCFLVKNINIEKGSGGASAQEQPDAYQSRYGTAAPAPGTSTAQLLANRYGTTPGNTAAQQLANRYGTGPASRYGSRYGGRGVPTAPAVVPQPTYNNPYLQGRRTSAARKGPETVLDEQLLRFTLRIEAVRPLMAAK